MNVHQEIVPEAEISETLGLGKKGRRRFFSAGRILGLLLVLVVLAGCWYVFAGGGSADEVRYVSEAARRGAITETVTATGTVEPTNKVEVSSELSGTVEKVFADYNDEVTSGEILASLDTDTLDAAVENARATLAVKKAQVEEAQATLSESEKAWERAQQLGQKDFASKSDQESAEATWRRAIAGLAVAKANVQVAEAELRSKETSLKKATIRSPINGVVLSRDIDPGQTVAASLEAPELFTIAEDLASMQLEVAVDEADVGAVSAGQKATFTVDAYRDRRFEAQVEVVRYASETVNDVVTYTAVLKLDNSELLLRPGMTATADITVKNVADALLVPNAALRFAPPAVSAADESSGSFLDKLIPHPPARTEVEKVADDGTGGRSIYVLEDGAPKKIAVEVGASDGSWTEVLSGSLKEGDAVITDAASTK
ncbi:efflux RND transporter periplasmic adaptor subunit [Afifella sp. IM 167]|uniref:efflux RND transporter periplasmic adaptor subunit n=1 Tax=Afifella sp. IM 167 TaxID=2033586 RepID=UPI001CC9ED02|nr:efflux RND transporter periplasmic adaptor subunit [Afifella sp. IM 167]